MDIKVPSPAEQEALFATKEVVKDSEYTKSIQDGFPNGRRSRSRMCATETHATRPETKAWCPVKVIKNSHSTRGQAREPLQDPPASRRTTLRMKKPRTTTHMPRTPPPFQKNLIFGQAPKINSYEQRKAFVEARRKIKVLLANPRKTGKASLSA